MHHVVLHGVLGRFFPQLVNRGRDHGEGGEQVVGDIGEYLSHLQSLPDAYIPPVDLSSEEESCDNNRDNGRNQNGLGIHIVGF